MLEAIRASRVGAPVPVPATIINNSAPNALNRMNNSNPLLERMRALHKATLPTEPTAPVVPEPAPETTIQVPTPAESANLAITQANQSISDKNGNLISYNSKQQEFVSLASSGASSVLIGAAGTGKTTCMKGTVQALIQNGKIGLLDAAGHKHLVTGSPGIVICAYTRRAVNNIRKNLSADVQSNCITIHKLLEYGPVYYEVVDEETGDTKTKMAFEPSRSSVNPLPQSIRTIIFEESSMIGTDLYKEVIDACPHNPQLIFLGDIQQLPPVFGPAILGFKLLSLPVVELTDVYRQALESPIISLAHRILSGNPIPKTEFESWKKPNQLTIHAWKKKISAQDALNTAGQFFIAAIKNHLYDPEEDMILIPFNKSFGTDELNKIIANHLSKQRGADTYEIIAGFVKHYLSPGDKVLYEKEDAEIVSITPNPTYTGAKYLHHSKTLDYWGFDPVTQKPEDTNYGDADVDFLLSQVASSEGDRVHQGSHILTLRMLDSEVEVKVDKAADLNSLLLGYCLTVHKSQGSEWRKVFFVAHQSHATMLQRELLYTAVTRAKEELYVICESETFVNGIKSQRVKGDTLAEKASYFQGKLDTNEDYSGY
jgi:exodeoxyribonuclease V alpha subunit